MARKAKSNKKGRARDTTTGSILETCREQLIQHGFEPFETWPQFCAAKSLGVLPERYMVYRYRHQSLYGTAGSKELYFFDHGDEYVMEAKFQTGSGSVDEKFPYVWMSFLASPIKKWILVYDGAWWEGERGSRAVEWAKRQEVPPAREWIVLARREFSRWVKRRWSTT